MKPEDELAREEGARVVRALRRHGVDHVIDQDPAEAHADLLVVVGDNPFLLSVVRRVPANVPVLGVGSSGFGVLTETTVEDFESHVRRLATGDYRVEAVDRMVCRVGERTGLALNEAALLSAEPGHIVRYSLWVADELVWRDRGDGLIVATPTGSTAYALAAGGPVVLAMTPVFSLVPVCSSSGRRPLVVSEDAALSVTDATADAGVELVLDGRERIRVGRADTVTIQRSDAPALFVRLGARRYTQMLGKLKTVARTPGASLKEAPPSAKFVLKLLEYEGPLTQQEMIRESELAERTVRNAVHYLLEQGIIQREPSLRDARQDVYRLRARQG